MAKFLLAFLGATEEIMFKHARAFGSFSVDDLGEAERFYGRTLGLEIERPMGQLQIDLAGGGRIFIYEKKDHQPATFTVFNIMVDDIDQAVAGLTERGVKFEQYDLPEIETDSRGIARGNGKGPDIAWFKDPAGNILSVLADPRKP